MTERYNKFVLELSQHLDDPDWLSQSAITLATILYNHNLEMAQAQLDETKVLVNLLDMPGDPKKMSFSEAEARAIAQTDNKYKAYKVTAEAIVETIMGIKKRLDVLSWEHRN